MAKKITWGIILTICSVLLIWIGISFMEVQAQNDIGPCIVTGKQIGRAHV